MTPGQVGKAIVYTIWFQSSPVPRGGCYAQQLAADIRKEMVSILTRPEGRVLRTNPGAVDRPPAVSILTRPEGRVLQKLQAVGLWQEYVSILTRPEGRVLRHRVPVGSGPVFGFNPHPSRGAGATSGQFEAVTDDGVSILTRPEGRVLQQVLSTTD